MRKFLTFWISILILFIVVLIICYHIYPFRNEDKYCLTPSMKEKIEKLFTTDAFSFYKIEEDHDEITIWVELSSYNEVIGLYSFSLDDLDEIADLYPTGSKINTYEPAEKSLLYLVSLQKTPEMKKLIENAHNAGKKVKLKMVQNLNQVKNIKISDLTVTDNKGRKKIFKVELLNVICEFEYPYHDNPKELKFLNIKYPESLSNVDVKKIEIAYK